MSVGADRKAVRRSPRLEYPRVVSRTAAHTGRRPSGVRARTRAALLEAALRVYAQKGVGAAAIHEIAAEAQVSNGTFYNYFRSREELLEAASRLLAARFTDEISASYAAVSDPAERVAIGCRRYLLRTIQDRIWGAAVLRVWSSTLTVSDRVGEAVLADLRAGRRRGRFRYKSERAAADLVQGTVLAGMRSMLEGRSGEEHATAVVLLILRGLGVPDDEAEAIVRKPLPPLG